MQVCNKHALALREQIEQRSMTHLIVHDREQRAAIAARLQVGQGRGNQDFEPTIQGQFMLAQLCGNSIKPQWAVDQLPEDLCPVCMCEAKNTIIAASWLRGVCDQLLEEAYERKLMKGQEGT